MSVQSVEKSAKQKMEGAMEALEREFRTVRTGRANPGILETVRVEAYGSEMPINQMANITTPDARTIQISPWDRSQIGHIERAIIAANLGLNPSNDGTVIRIAIPALTEERRKEIVKVAHKMAEDARVAVRHVRKHANDEIKKLEKDHSVSEDQAHDGYNNIQKLTDEYIKAVDDRLKEKEEEIMEV